MKKKILSILLSLAMIITMMPAMSMTAFATEEVKDVVSWYDLQHEIDIASGDAATKIKLMNDIECETDGLVIAVHAGKKIELDLNGHTINRNLSEATANGFVIAVRGELTLVSSADPKGKITGGNNNLPTGGGVCVDPNGKFIMNGGIITANKSTAGGGVFVNKSAQFVMNGGKIENNTSIADNKGAQGGGGGIFLRGSFELNGGEISGNAARTGGGVYVYAADDSKTKTSTNLHFIMKAGKISNNTASDDAGGVYADNYDIDTQLLGGEICKNKAGKFAGGVCCNMPVFVGGNIKIQDNTSGDNISDNAFLNNETKKAFSPILKNSTSTPLSSDAKIGVKLESGTGNFIEGVDSGDASRFTIDEAQTTDYEIKFESRKLKLAWKENVASGWTDLQNTISSASKAICIQLTNDISASATDNAITIPSGKTITIDLNGHTIDRGLLTAKSNGYVIEVKGNLTINNSGTNGHGIITGGYGTDYCGGVYVHNGSTLTILGGTISNNKAQYGGGIYITSGAKVTVAGNAKIDNNEASAGGGILTAGELSVGGDAIISNNKTVGGLGANGGGVQILQGGSMKLSANAKIAKNHSADGGGGVFARGNFTMSGGEISENEAVSHAGGVYVYGSCDSVQSPAAKSCFFKMVGGKICNNKSQKEGGGVYVDYYDMEMIMTGGSITGNKASEDGAGIYVNQYATFGGTAKVSGNVLIGNSKANNVFSSAEAPIHIATGKDAPQASMCIGVSTKKTPTSAEAVVITTSCDLDYCGNISPDVAKIGVRYTNTKVHELVYGKCAIGNKMYETLKEAVSAVKDNETIVLYDDAVSTSISKAITFMIDNNGHAFSPENITAGKGYKITYKMKGTVVTFTVTESGIDVGGSGGGELSEDDGKMTLTMTYGGEPYTFKNGNSAKYTSKDTKVVTVDENGVVKVVGAGTTTITVTDKTSGATKDITVTVNPKTLTIGMVSNINSQDYTGSEIKPTVTIKDGTTVLVQGTTTAPKDYTVSYKNNTIAASKTSTNAPTITITGQGNYTGTITVKFSILKKLDFEVPDTTTGTPKVVIKDGDYKLVKDTDYTVEYKNKDEIGFATCIIKGKGKYAEYYKEIIYKVIPKKSTVSKYTAGKKKATITWKKVAGNVDGYWIRVATDKKFKKNLQKIRITKGTTTKKVVKKLKSGKRYYVKVRAYKKALNPSTGKNANIYANWSSIKRTKTIK